MSHPITYPPLIDEPAKLPASERIHVEDAHLITEDGKPVDGIYSERQMRLLTEALYTSWKPGRKFMACANVGIFYVNENPPICPDVFVSLDVEPFPDMTAKVGKSYCLWEKGKSPEIVIEVVSNTEGEELTRKRGVYARNLRVPYYVIWDPAEFLKRSPLTVLRLGDGDYEQMSDAWFPILGLGLTVWDGVYGGVGDQLIRWSDAEGRLLKTGGELAREADDLQHKTALLAAKLRELGHDPDKIAESRL